MDNSKLFYLILYLTLFFISQTFTTIGAFISLPYKNLTFWEAYKMAIPYSWISWLFLTYALHIVHTYKLISNTQILFLIIFVQFTLVLIANRYFFGKIPSFSDIVAFILIFIGYVISVNHVFSRLLGIEVEKHDENTGKTKEEAEKTEEEQQLDTIEASIETLN